MWFTPWAKALPAPRIKTRFKHHVFYSFAKIRLRPNFHHRIQPFAKGFNPPVILRRAFVGVSRRIGEAGR